MSVLWLFLITIELFCPALCGDDDATFAAELQQTQKTEINFTTTKDDGSTEKTTAATSVSDNQIQNQHKTICNDECLCHATAIVAFPFAVQKVPFTRSIRIIYYRNEPVSSSLPPPDRPPNIS